MTAETKDIPLIREWKPIEVNVGGLCLGATHPVRIQSMTNTPTSDIKATVDQSIRLVRAGCEIVRIAVPGMKEAKNLALIKTMLLHHGIKVPIVADVHFNPRIAEYTARIVEKVRINPGNYTDKRAIPAKGYSDQEYKDEIEKIAQRLRPLLNICSYYGTAIRIGTNHGSLSGRIVERYGDTPLGMAESAMEFVRICADAGFRNLVLSMKSSNVLVMIQSTLLLVQKMIEENLMFPVHLGVTEAGSGIEGRIKSAAGVGLLLARGIGDTVRISLTEDPVNEIPVAKQIVSLFPKPSVEDFYERVQLFSDLTLDFGQRINRFGKEYPLVIKGCDLLEAIREDMTTEGFSGKVVLWDKTAVTSGDHFEYLAVASTVSAEDIINTLKTELNKLSKALLFDVSSIADFFRVMKVLKRLNHIIHTSPVVIRFRSDLSDNQSDAVYAATLVSPFLLYGLCDGINLINSGLDGISSIRIAFSILQATRKRITQTEYIACPGCGRTQFDLEGTLQRVKDTTSHLKGLKIAVMGCIVNGPGEMADADYGYIGQGNGKVTLYAGKTPVLKNIPEEEALEALIRWLKERGHWLDQ